MQLEVKFSFDNDTYRHYMNGHETVLHCHHYMTLTTKLAETFAELGSVEVLRESAEDSIRPLIDDYIKEHKIDTPEDRLAVGMEYYSVMGLGILEVKGAEQGGEVTLSHSHVDQGWIKKWGNSDKPVNHFTCGYVAAMFAAAFDKPQRSYAVTEVSSIAVGDEVSKLVAKLT